MASVSRARHAGRGLAACELRRVTEYDACVRRKDVFRALIEVSAVAFSVGCGSGNGGGHRTGSAGGTHYTLAATTHCLAGHATLSHSRADAFAQSASRGGIGVTIDGEVMSIAFGKDAAEARKLLSMYKSFTGDSSSRLYRKGNAVLAWSDDPGSTKTAVDGCLS